MFSFNLLQLSVFIYICFTGYIDPSARIMQVITWNRAFRGLPCEDDEFFESERENLANVLDKMLAWEKKLYEEMKVTFLLFSFFFFGSFSSGFFLKLSFCTSFFTFQIVVQTWCLLTSAKRSCAL